MTINTVDRPHRPTHQLPSRGSHFSGTLGLLRLYLRRDRIVLPAVGAPAVRPAVDGLRRQHRSRVSLSGRPSQLRGDDHGQSRTAGAVRKRLRRQPRRHRHLEGRHVRSAHRRRRHPDGDPAHPRRRGDRALGAHRLHRRRPLRQPHGGAAARMRRVAAHRCHRYRGAADGRRPRGRLAGLRIGAGVLGAGVHRRRRGDGPAVTERPVRPRRRIRRARGGIHAACRRRRELRGQHALVALPARLGVAGAAVCGRPLLGAAAARRDHGGADRGRLPAAWRDATSVPG